ncbi:Protein GrpE [Bienertia sinuspersici]
MSDFGLEGINLSDSSTSSVADVCISESIFRRTDMNEQQRRNCIRILLHKAEGLTLRRGTQQEVAHQFGVSRWTIGRIWKCVQKYLRERQQLKVSKNYKGKVGRKQLNLPDQAIMDLPLRKRCNIRSMAASLNISKSSVHRLIKWGKIKRHSKILKCGGGNNFNLPHAAKHRLEREGALPTTVSVSTQIVSNAIKSLLEQFHRLQTG